MTDDLKRAAQAILDNALTTEKGEGNKRVFAVFHPDGKVTPEAIDLECGPVELLANGALVNAADLPSGTKAGEAIYMGIIRLDTDGVALKSMADPNFDEDGNCINETMREFLKTRVRKN